jgi:hypothetical protein
MNHPVDAPADTSATAEPAAELTGKLLGSTRRSFIRDVAVAGTSTAAALYGLDASGAVDLVGQAEAAAPDAPLSEFSAIAPSVEDTIRVPEGFSWQVVIGYGDQFANTDGTVYRYGYNNDYLAYFPLRGSEEGLLFVNHEYVDAFFTHGYKTSDVANGKHTKSRNEVRLEQEAVGNSIVHVRRREDGAWQVVSPSPYNRRIFGGDVKGERLTPLSFTGPVAGDPKIGGSAQGSIGNCSGGTTPWGTALSCEENYDGYGVTFGASTRDFEMGWDWVGAPVGDDVQQTGERRSRVRSTWPPRAAGREPPLRLGLRARPLHARAGAQAHGARPLPPREHGVPRRARQALRDLHGRRPGQPGRLQVRLDPLLRRSGHGRGPREQPADPHRGPALRRPLRARGAPPLRTSGDLEPVTPESGTGRWMPVDVSDLFDTRLRLAGVGTGETFRATPRTRDRTRCRWRAARASPPRRGNTGRGGRGPVRGPLQPPGQRAGGEPYLGATRRPRATTTSGTATSPRIARRT